MYKGARVGVVVPAYNEAGFIGEVIGSIPNFVDKIVVVDDCSTDATWAEIREYVDQESAETAISENANAEVLLADGAGTSVTGGESFLDNRIIPVRHPTNQGRGAAVKTGYDLALMSGMDVIAVMDGDAQMDPEILDRIIDPVVEGRVDYAKGNRLVSVDHCSDMSRWRLFGNVLLTLLTKIASGQWNMRDPQNGYTAISAEALEELEHDELFEDYGFLNDMLIHLDAHGMDVEDVPMDAKYGDESSGIRYGSFVPQLSLLLLSGFVWRLGKKYFNRA